MKIISLIFAVLIIFTHSEAAGAAGTKISPEIISKIETQWKKVDTGDISWRYIISPPFPVNWPEKDQQYFYVYAAGQDIRKMIADGEYTAAPWARIESSSSGQKLVILSKKLKNIGIQGVRPLTDEESKIAAKQSGGIQKDYYCLWIKNNGVIAEKIKPSHESFFRWLECK